MKKLTNNEILNIAREQSVRFVVSFVNSDGTEAHAYGFGIIIKGEFLATCYHILLPRNNAKLSKVCVIYNEHIIDGVLKYDSVLATKSFKAKDGQYDFSKHNYVPEDASTDFILLKLEHKIITSSYKFKQHEMVYNDTLYSLGNHMNLINGVQSINLLFDESSFVIYYKQSPLQEAIFIGCIGNAGEGFSGSPVYNSYGEITSIIQFGMDDVPYSFINPQHDSGVMKDDLYDRILTAYNENKRLFFSIDIDYIKNKYLKGYL